MAKGRSSSRSPAPSRSYGSSARSAPAPAASTATRQNPTAGNKPLAHPPAAASSAAPAAHHAPPQQQQQFAPQQQSSGGGGMLSGLAGTVMSGMAFGTGSAVAHRAVDAVMGPREVQHVHQNAEGAPAAAAAAPRAACTEQNTKFMACMKENQGSIASCQYLFDVLSQCQRDQQ